MTTESIIPHTGPVARAPAPLRAAVEAAQQRFDAGQTQANWLLLRAAIQAAIDHDDRAKGREAA